MSSVTSIPAFTSGHVRAESVMSLLAAGILLDLLAIAHTIPVHITVQWVHAIGDFHAIHQAICIAISVIWIRACEGDFFLVCDSISV